MNAPEEVTVVKSGDQVTPVVPAQDQAPASEQPTGSIYESEETLKKEVDRLSSISNSGDPAEMSKALEGLSDIEKYLEKKRNAPTPAPADTATSTEAPVAPVVPVAPAAPVVAGKKFTVDWQSKKHEFSDDDGLLGHGSTGRLKAAHLKLKLSAEERERELTERLRVAEDKLRQVPATPAAPAPTPAPAVPASTVSRPTPPIAPKLSTNDPSLYTEADVTALNAYTEATGKFNNDLVRYLVHIEERTGKTDPAVLAELETHRKWRAENAPEIERMRAENKRLADEKADLEHWQKFVDFQHKHSSFSTPLAPDKMDAAMQKWMGKIAQANGIPENDMPRRAEIVGKYLNGDETVLKNSEGLEPPEGHQAYFKMLELVGKRKAYIDAKILADNSTLEDTYLRMKADSGDLDADIEVIRTSERTAATEAFASNIQQIQQQAGGIDPSKSAGGVDINELGFSAQDMKWFNGVSVNPDNLLTLQAKDPQGFLKWEAMAAAIEKKYLR